MPTVYKDSHASKAASVGKIPISVHYESKNYMQVTLDRSPTGDAMMGTLSIWYVEYISCGREWKSASHVESLRYSPSQTF